MIFLGLNGIDWGILALLASFALIGMYRGLIREIFTLMGVFLSVLFAFLLMVPTGRLLSRWIELSERIQLIVGFLTVYLLALILFHLLFFMLSRIYRIHPVGMGDRIAGFFFGLFKGGFIVFVLLFFIGLLPLTSRISKVFHNSTIMRMTRETSPSIEKFLSTLPKLKNLVDTRKGKILIEKSDESGFEKK